jgi:hypothetical protein
MQRTTEVEVPAVCEQKAGTRKHRDAWGSSCTRRMLVSAIKKKTMLENMKRKMLEKYVMIIVSVLFSNDQDFSFRLHSAQHSLLARR